MIIKFMRQTCFTFALVILLTCNGCAIFQQETNVIRPSSSLPDAIPWDLIDLSQPPTYEWSDLLSPVRSLYYAGQDYKGKPTRVFAYYASPATLDATYSGDKTFPAVVLVHGGGGTAFKEWVQLWANRGYAAIAMDLTGFGQDRKRLSDGGPNNTDNETFGLIDQPAENQWTYHGVADVILAHSLIRSFDEVDASRTAVTGISWGGYLTCTVAGLDSRFKAAVPVYGCGFLHYNGAWLGRLSNMTPQQKDKWVHLWDPSMYVGSVVMPMFFVNGTNDSFYPLDSYAKTYGLVKSERNFRITVNMLHSHQHGWAPKEIGLFIDQHLKAGIPLATILKPELVEGKVHAKVKSKVDITSAHLHYTTGTTPINKLSWKSVSADLDSNQLISCALPEKATIWFLTVTDSRGAIVSSEVIFSTK
jgi:dienelactone hydrolase